MWIKYLDCRGFLNVMEINSIGIAQDGNNFKLYSDDIELKTFKDIKLANMVIEKISNRIANKESMIDLGFICNECEEELAQEKLYLRINSKNKDEKLEMVKKVISQNDGNVRVVIHNSDSKETMALDTRVDLKNDLIKVFEEMFGTENVKLVRGNNN